MKTTKSIDPANRGKETEKEVELFLKKMNGQTKFAYSRFPDARSARGFLAAQPADFLVVCNGVVVLLEVKHTNHPYRLPKDKLSQHAMLAKFAEAGAVGLLIVHHEGLGWRIINVTRLTFGVPSWDLSKFPIYSNAESALFAAFDNPLGL